MSLRAARSGQAAAAGDQPRLLSPASPLGRCLDCGELTDRARCPDCAELRTAARDRRRGSTVGRGYGGSHQRSARNIVRAAKVCWICNEPGRPDDPLTADHRVPVARGGSHREGYRAAHRSCNSRRGAGL